MSEEHRRAEGRAAAEAVFGEPVSDSPADGGETSDPQPASGPQPGPAPSTDGASDPLDVLWAAIRSSWTEEKRHQAFLAHCQERDALPEAARRYRALGSDPNATDEEKRVADQKLRSITALALSKLANEKASPAGAGMKYIRLAAALILAAALLLLGWALAR